MPPRTTAGRLLAAALIVAAVAAAGPAPAKETDQFYSWGRPLQDSTEAVNERLNREIRVALETVNGRGARAGRTCHRVRRELADHLKQFLFHEIEIWTARSSRVDRIPADAQEELRYRREYLYHNHGPLDLGTTIPPSPTISVGGVRIGTDKISHFLSEGWWYFRWYRSGREKGLSPDQAERRAMRRGLLFERTILGRGASGVLSLADLEANYEGMLFYRDLCDEHDPLLIREGRNWRLRRPLDLTDYVGPEWDESYQPSLFSPGRWRKVRPVLLQYCEDLDDPQVVRLRAEYARRDRETATESWIRDLVQRGKL